MSFTVTFLVFAAFVTKIVDFIRNTVGTKFVMPKWMVQLTAFAVGIVVAILYQQADVSQIAGLPPIFAEATGTWAMVIMGMALGASASGFHELFDALSGVAKRNRPQE